MIQVPNFRYSNVSVIQESNIWILIVFKKWFILVTDLNRKDRLRNNIKKSASILDNVALLTSLTGSLFSSQRVHSLLYLIIPMLLLNMNSQK